MPVGKRSSPAQVTFPHAGAGELPGPLATYPAAVTLSIEPAPEVQARVCKDCGRSFSTVHGFLYQDDDAYAVYHASLQSDHPSTQVDLALSLGSWQEEATANERKRIGLRIWPEGDELKMHFNDVSESTWGDSATFGTMLTRNAVLGSRLEGEALSAAEFIVSGDERVRVHLENT